MLHRPVPFKIIGIRFRIPMSQGSSVDDLVVAGNCNEMAPGQLGYVESRALLQKISSPRTSNKKESKNSESMNAISANDAIVSKCGDKVSSELGNKIQTGSAGMNSATYISKECNEIGSSSSLVRSSSAYSYALGNLGSGGNVANSSAQNSAHGANIPNRNQLSVADETTINEVVAILKFSFNLS